MRQKRAEHTKRRCTNTRWDDRARRFRALQAAPAAQRRRLVAERIDRPATPGCGGSSHETFGAEGTAIRCTHLVGEGTL
jgi:hypothetical protein